MLSAPYTLLGRYCLLPGKISVMAWNLFVLTIDLVLKLNTKYYNLILILHMPTVVLGVYYSASF